MKYRLTFEDYLQYQLYYMTNNQKKAYYRKRAGLLILIGVIVFLITGLTGNGWFVLGYGILLAPIWIATKYILELRARMDVKKRISGDYAYLAETTIEIIDDVMVKEVLGVKVELPLSNIKNVVVDKDLIYVEFPDGTRIIPSRAFESEAQKGEYLDNINYRGYNN